MIYFKDVPGYEGKYQVSNDGKVWTYFNKSLRRSADIDGYKSVILVNENGKQSRKGVHRLVMAAFRGESTLHVNHIDHNRSNNNLDNLEYVTPKQNVAHCKAAGRLKPNIPHLRALAKGQRKLSDSDVRTIRNSNTSTIHLASVFGLSRQTIQAVRNSVTYRDVQ